MGAMCLAVAGWRKALGHRACGGLESGGALKGTDGPPKVTERAQNADFRRFTPSPGKLKHLEGAGNRRLSQKNEDFRRKPQIWLRLLMSVTFISAPLKTWTCSTLGTAGKMPALDKSHKTPTRRSPL